MNAQQIRSWLLQQPRAAELRVTNGKEKSTIAVAGQSWAKLSQTLEAMQADRIDAVDGGGNILRSVRPADVDEDEEKPVAAEPVAAMPAQAYDPETVRFELMAKLLSEAHKFSTGVAWDKMTAIVDAMSRRADQMERVIERQERALSRHAEDLLAEAEEKAEQASADPLKEMVGAFMGGMGGNGSAAAKPNGKG